MKYLNKYENWMTNESFSSLSEEEKSKLHLIMNEIINDSREKVNGNSEVANPKGKASNPFYDRGTRDLEGLGKPFGSFVPGSINKKDGKIEAIVEHGMNYESGLKKRYKTKIEMDAKTFEYSTKKIDTEL